MQPHLTFTGSKLDRAVEKRGDADWLAAKAADSAARIIALHGLKPFATASAGGKRAKFLSPAELAACGGTDAILVFLGLRDGRAYFALDVSAADENSMPFRDGAFEELRGLSFEIPEDEAAMLAQARALLHWHARHGFCAACGAPAKLMDGGYRRLCGKCGAEHFPRTDPVVIMLAIHDERCLLGRQKTWPEGNYSALAGFMEPGESIEEAVKRELKEEAGIEASEVRYALSQPWPFPSSLMIGCFARAEGHALSLNDGELEDARWFTRSDLVAMLAGTHATLRVPPRIAIAHHLVRLWLGK